MAKQTLSDKSAWPGFAPLVRIDMHTPVDALLTVPSSYIDASYIYESLADTLRELGSGRSPLIAQFTVTRIQGFGKKGAIPENLPQIGKNTRSLLVTCTDNQERMFDLKIFGAGWDWKNKAGGDTCILTVKSAKYYGTALSMDASLCDKRMSGAMGTVSPLYAGLQGAVKGSSVTANVDTAVEMAGHDPALWAAARDKILSEARSPERELLRLAGAGRNSIVAILQSLHRPDNYQAAIASKEMVVRIAAAAISSRAKHFFSRRPANALCAVDGIASSAADLMIELRRTSGITLTKNQRQCIQDITDAMSKPAPSAHMLNGDVGTGKTLTYLIPAIAAFRKGKNVAIMAPTGILADQLHSQIAVRFPGTPVSRIEAGGKLPAARAILVGTPGITSVCAKAGWTADVLIIDEQHKMSTLIREAMVADHTHLIEATATPIPRSLAISLYGGMTQLVLSESPVKKTLLSKAIYGAEGRKDLSIRVSKALHAGAKVAFIYPVVKSKNVPADMNEDPAQAAASERASVLGVYARMNEKWPDKVACIYGAMPDVEQRAAIESFRSGDKAVLVASSLIEVGLDIPEIEVLVVSGANYFGLSQLHQFRGRLARSGGTGYFMMYVDKPIHQVDKKTIDRLRAMETIDDGFRLAEVDLAHRGFGDTAGDAQSGRAYTVFTGINLSARDFLRLSTNGNDGQQIEIADISENVDAPEDAGQMSLL